MLIIWRILQVDYGLDNGGKVQIPWAGRMNFAKGEELKLSSYRVNSFLLDLHNLR